MGVELLDKNTEQISDEILVGLVIEGDQQAYAVLVERHLTPIFRLSYSLLGDASRAEDVTQETFMTLWQSAEKWKPSGQLRSWLFRIARNKSIDEMRRAKPHTDIEQTVVKDGEKSPYAQVLDHEISDIVNTTIKVLPPRQREAIMLVHFLGCTNIEAAETMKISVDAIESLLSRGRKKLKSLLDGHKDIFFKGGIK